MGTTFIVQAMQRVLITGGAGFIGSSLVNTLMTSRNCNIIVLDNLSRGSLDNISSWVGSPDFEFVQYDMLEYSNPFNERESALQGAVDRSDIIFHLAANPDVVIGAENTRIDFQQNVQVTYNLLEAIRKSKANVVQKNANITEIKKKQLIFASSSTVYGEAIVKPTPENYSPLYPISLYGATKLAGEAIVSGYCHMFDIQCIVARLANIVGPTNSHGVVHDFISKLSSHPDYLEILGNGQQNKSYLYIDDCVSALILLSEKLEEDYDDINSLAKNEKMNSQPTYVNPSDRPNGIHNNNQTYHKQSRFEVFNIGSDDTITVTEIAQTVIDRLSLKRDKVKNVFKNTIEGGRGWKGDVPDFWLDCSKLKAAGWSPKYKKKQRRSDTYL
ncbi:MAG: NAD-dependent epimerase/dehydratase family protein [Nitrososphaeraceae archaeon]